ncbi:MAG: hypothetical protein LQ340_006541, partial [Diploschistes diacapsis]
RRLNERLSLPFTRYFYYTKDTPADIDFRKKLAARNGTAARDIGPYNPHRKGPGAWNDELLVGAKESETQEQVEALLRDAVVEVEEEVEDQEGGRETRKRVVQVERPQARETEADRAADVGSLNRALERTLYLVVRGREGGWEFPAGRLEGRESLHRVSLIILFIPRMGGHLVRGVDSLSHARRECWQGLC